MKRYRLNVLVEALEDGRFLATTTDLEGCLAEGETISDALDNLEDAARVMIEVLTEKGWPLPKELADSGELPIVEAKVVVSIGG